METPNGKNSITTGKAKNSATKQKGWFGKSKSIKDNKENVNPDANKKMPKDRSKTTKTVSKHNEEMSLI